MAKVRTDHWLITNIVEKNSRVLDIGCADGKLLHLLIKNKSTSVQGIEIEHEKVEACLKKGLSVVEGDANKEIISFPDNSFDYVILSQTLQTVEKPKWILEQILRVGKKAIISFPNFGHWYCRYQVALYGKMPITKELKLPWYDTKNIHFCTIKDFCELIEDMKFITEKKFGINKSKTIIRFPFNKFFLNFLASHAVFLISS